MTAHVLQRHSTTGSDVHQHNTKLQAGKVQHKPSPDIKMYSFTYRSPAGPHRAAVHMGQGLAVQPLYDMVQVKQQQRFTKSHITHPGLTLCLRAPACGGLRVRKGTGGHGTDTPHHTAADGSTHSTAQPLGSDCHMITAQSKLRRKQTTHTPRTQLMLRLMQRLLYSQHAPVSRLFKPCVGSPHHKRTRYAYSSHAAHRYCQPLIHAHSQGRAGYLYMHSKMPICRGTQPCN
jgi:hypothetical protein